MSDEAKVTRFALIIRSLTTVFLSVAFANALAQGQGWRDAPLPDRLHTPRHGAPALEEHSLAIPQVAVPHTEPVCGFSPVSAALAPHIIYDGSETF